MKVRNDYVTNSSSVSYIITMKKDIVECYERAYKGMRNIEIEKITKFLKDYLSENGILIYLSGEDILYKKVEFRTDGDTTDKENLESEKNGLDFSILTDDELWSYILGEYILKGKLSQIDGFGSMQVKTF